jgi:hypothetical protein
MADTPLKPGEAGPRVRHVTAAVAIGPAQLLEADAERAALEDRAGLSAIDFQARQDAINEKRKGPPDRLAVKTKTRAKPTEAPETKL